MLLGTADIQPVAGLRAVDGELGQLSQRQPWRARTIIRVQQTATGIGDGEMDWHAQMARVLGDALREIGRVALPRTAQLDQRQIDQPDGGLDLFRKCARQVLDIALAAGFGQLGKARLFDGDQAPDDQQHQRQIHHQVAQYAALDVAAEHGHGRMGRHGIRHGRRPDRARQQMDSTWNG